MDALITLCDECHAIEHEREKEDPDFRVIELNAAKLREEDRFRYKTMKDDDGNVWFRREKRKASSKIELSTAKEVWQDRRLVIVFQPHRYSRTKYLMESFFSSFNDADQLLLLDIYSAGEEAEEGIHSQRIAEGVKEFGHKNVEYIGSTQSVIPHLQKILKPGDIVMTLGAGNIGELSHRLASRFND
jgi:hypothetical protein